MTTTAPTTYTTNVVIGSTGVPTQTNSSCALEVQTTAGAFVLPRMTTTQKNALTAVNGMQVYDSTLGAVSSYQGGAWGSATGVSYATGTLSLANLTGMYATPVSLIAAPGAGFMTVVNRIVIEFIFGSAAFTSGGAVYLQYGATAHGTNYATDVAAIPAAVLTGLSANTAISTAGTFALTSGLATSVCGNAAVTLTNATAAFATGTGCSARYYVWYTTVPIT